MIPLLGSHSYPEDRCNQEIVGPDNDKLSMDCEQTLTLMILADIEGFGFGYRAGNMHVINGLHFR
jgi:hypothetical protein